MQVVQIPPVRRVVCRSRAGGLLNASAFFGIDEADGVDFLIRMVKSAENVANVAVVTVASSAVENVVKTVV